MSTHFKRLEGKKSNALRDEDYDEPLIIELKNGKTYGGMLDEFEPYDGGIVHLYSCKLLDKKGHRWVEHDMLTKFEGRTIRDFMPSFWLEDIENIFELSDDLKGRFYMDDVLQLYIDPHHNPLPKVECDWNPSLKLSKHNPECDARLHEALSFLLTEMEVVSTSVSPQRRDGEPYKKFSESFEYVRRRLVMYGARIP